MTMKLWWLEIKQRKVTNIYQIRKNSGLEDDPICGQVMMEISRKTQAIVILGISLEGIKLIAETIVDIIDNGTLRKLGWDVRYFNEEEWQKIIKYLDWSGVFDKTDIL